MKSETEGKLGDEVNRIIRHNILMSRKQTKVPRAFLGMFLTSKYEYLYRTYKT